MFKSKLRPIIIPQYEHGRLAGTLAQYWGNDQFDRPVMNFASFVRGVALHDWHYGFGDNLPIIGAREEDWLGMTRRGIELCFDDPVTDIVAKLHLRRLLSYNPTPTRMEMMGQIDAYVTDRLPETGITRADFDWADSITHFCDNVAFYFSFESLYEQTMQVGHRSGVKTAITYQIKPKGKVVVDPWPFSIPFLSGITLGYQAEGYPEQLDPLVVPFEITPKTDNV